MPARGDNPAGPPGAERAPGYEERAGVQGARVRPATPVDHEAAAEALALAFVDDPGWIHFLPEEETRGERLLRFFTAEIANVVPRHRELWVSEDGGAAALWGRPGAWRVPAWTTVRPLRSMVEVFGSRLALATWAQLRFERHHPRRPEHWYLHYIGVEPRRQGRGLGAALLAPVLGRCDREGTAAHLESSSERSRGLYERHGFEMTGTFALPAGGPPIREMWREPRPREQPGAA
jgi:GNAT superfamily N-acetyltransferase